MSGFSIEQSKQHIDELNVKVEKSKLQVENLEQERKQIIETRTEIEGADISEEAKKVIIKALNEQIERVSEEAGRKSDEIGDTLKEFEEEIQRIQEANENTGAETEKLEDRKAVLERIHRGRTMDTAIAELEKEGERIGGLNAEAINGRKETENLIRRLSAL